MPTLTEWCNADDWAVRMSPTGCRFCKSADTGLGEGLLIQRLSASRLILAHNQHILGYSVLILDSHHVELHQLSESLAWAFLSDLRASMAALTNTFRPRKLNIEMQGNQVPHLHAHLKPRYPTDSPGHGRISHTRPVLALDADSAMERAAAIRAAIHLQHPLAETSDRLNDERPQ